MTADDIAKGRALAEAATGLPWVTVEPTGLFDWEVRQCPDAFPSAIGYVQICETMQDDPDLRDGADAAYIVHACNTLPAALDEIERLRALVRRGFNEGHHGCALSWKESKAKEALG